MKKLLLTLMCTTVITTSFAYEFSNNVGGVPNLGYTGQSVFPITSFSDKAEFKKVDNTFSTGMVGIKAVYDPGILHDNAKYQYNGIALRKDIILTTASSLWNQHTNKLFTPAELRLYNPIKLSKYDSLTSNDIQIFVPKSYNGSVATNNDLAIIKIKNTKYQQFLPIPTTMAIAGGKNSRLSPGSILDSDFVRKPQTLFATTWGSSYREGTEDFYSIEKMGCLGMNYDTNAKYTVGNQYVLEINNTVVSGTPAICKTFDVQEEQLEDASIIASDRGSPFLVAMPQTDGTAKFELLGVNAQGQGKPKIVTLGYTLKGQKVENPAWTELKSAAGVTGF